MKIKHLVWLLPVLLIAALFVKSCDKPGQPALPTGPLPSDDLLQVGIKDHVITARTEDSEESVYAPEHGHAVVTLTKKGDVILDVKSKGFTFSPVVGPFITDRLGVAGGIQFAYWNRFEGYAGIAGPSVAGFIATGYRLDQLHLNNTSVFVAYTTRKEIAGGVFVRF